MIRELFIKNYRSIVETSLPLEPLTVLIGPNNAGKTNLLRAIRHLSDASIGPGRAPLKVSQDGLTGTWPMPLKSSVANHSLDETTKLTAKTDAGTIHCEFDGRRPMTTEVKITAETSSGGPQKIAEAPLLEVRSSEIYCFEPAVLRRPVQMQAFRQVGTLGPDGFGLAGVLFALQSDRPDLWDALLEEFHTFVPSIRRINFADRDAGITLAFWEEGQRNATSIEDASDGIVLLTALLAVRYAVKDTAIVLLEDPERGIHPRRLHEVTSTLLELSEGTDAARPVQIVMTSHSPYFLDRFRDSPNSVVVVERSTDRGTVCTPLGERMKDLPEGDASLGELWYSGVLGGVPREAKA